MTNSRQPIQKRDLWDKAAILSTFLSSVVITIIGIAISYSVQRSQIRSSEASAKAQLDAARLQATNNTRLDQARLTAQLLEYLASNDVKRREIALVALHESVPADTYEKVAAIVARSDSNSSVRRSAIRELSQSMNPSVVATLTSIANDHQRDKNERALAAQSAAKVSVGATGGGGPVVLAAASGAALEDVELGGGIFTHFLLRGLRGEAGGTDGQGPSIVGLYD